jgi:hypothetical protein
MYVPPKLLVAIALLAAVSTAAAEPLSVGGGSAWRTYSVPEFGTSIEYPVGIFAVADGKAEKGTGQQFSSTDGRALLSIYSRANESGETPSSYLQKNLRVERWALGYQRVTRFFFAISASHQGLIFYSRCNFSRGADAAVHCFDLVYPHAEKRGWDGVVTRISRSLRPLEG